MSIRTRLALWYGGLFILILLLVSLFSYAIHDRSQYDDLDRTLVVSAGHSAAEASAFAGRPHLVEGTSSVEIVLRLYSPNGTRLESSLDDEGAPAVDPLAVLHHPSGPAYDALAHLSPPLTGPPTTGNGAFGILSTSEQRWRVYVIPIQKGSAITGYIAAMTPLGRVDASIQTFRLILLVLDSGGLALALAGSWLVARRALRPVARLTETAQSISLSRDLSRRVETPTSFDELGRLAATFNDMLTSLETASQTQQRFVSDASHELRAPLTAIQGNIDLLRRIPDMSEADHEDVLNEMEREAGRLSRLVADLLMLARADAGVSLKRCPLDLDPIILDVFREAHHLAHGQTLALEPFEPVKVEGNEDRLKQMILILVDNALKYTPSGGQVTLGMRRDGIDAEVIVRDTGIGIAPEEISLVFERFYRADSARNRDPGGTGLGLPIARWIAEQHEGTVRLESEPGKGTTAIIRLPLCRCP